ncbi:GntR family transcriptional regulator [Corynebacterium glucuronolyticum]|uniref:GntR family transcriptional regulator n=1 Tax=Corynebacterium glucuronolyticum TaxID=39791 RepID=A0A7T4EGY7_9CORY|nr:GntR family transcriptional regulator [Corynebacterium glucuronolyticum]EEI25877.1 transcriptional regulator, GntR family [Corynebacterium glucuronolyticum ATCC 51867]MCT1564553.1 GntR family transcriptional regulator [Corynebacterium glucuronolyticum]QQB47215.1 GntR family transcriptional regulator [Corynebacterium glucuronolyticum]QQU88873.1 GntR family transcriptional regulator [Corynebacterium glucuronolyticum]QRO82535.1 GntR family transcriptional regulator [Corynebacterium glucuronoly
MDIVVSNASPDPIYAQIKDQLKAAIINDQVVPGEKLPSIRRLASQLRVSVITTKRAYDELELEGFIDSVQGRGSFVASKNTELLKEEQRKKVEDHLKSALAAAPAAGLSIADLKELIDVLGVSDE